MKLTPGTQEALLALLCYGSKTDAILAAALVPASLYDAGFRDIAEKAHDFVSRYKEAPSEHVLDIFEQLEAEWPKKAPTYNKIFESLQETKEGINAEFVLSQAKLFARYQQLKTKLADGIELLEQGTEDAINRCEATLLANAGAGQELLDLGTDLSDTRKSLSFLDEMFDVFPTGIETFDQAGYGPVRKGLHILIAPPNSGKTWWLVNLGKQALLHRKRVLHITLEMSEAKIAMRYIQALFAIPKRKAKITLGELEKDEDGAFVNIDYSVITPEKSLTDKDIRPHLTRKIDKTFASRPRLLVKEFPSGSLTHSQLETYLELLANRDSFYPDLVLLDYADLMAQDAKYLRETTGQTVVKLRGIAMARNLAMATCSQTNRGGATAETVRNEDVAEDYSKIATADTIVTLNRSDLEEKHGLARLFVSKARDEERHSTAVISQAYGIGQFAVDSARMSSDFWDTVKNTDNGD